MSFVFFLESLIVSPIRAEKVKHQRSHFWTLCRIFGRLRISAVGTVFNDNLTSCPEHAIIYTEVINITFIVNSKKLLRTFPRYVSRHFLTKKTIPRSLAFHQILSKNLFSHCLFYRLLAGSSDFYPFNVSTACLLILPLQ
jgi:hypothetical protein